MQSFARQLLRANSLALRSARVVPSAAAPQRLLALSSSRLFSTTLMLREDFAQRGERGERRMDRGGDRGPRRSGPKDGGMAERRPYVPRTDTPPSSCLFLGNLHYDVERADIQELLTNFGEIMDVRFVMRDGRKMGSAFVEFADQSSAERAWKEIREHMPEIYGRAVRVDYAISRPKEARTPRLQPQPEGPRLFISNAVGVNLQELFKGHNPVDIWQPMDKPFAFATFESIEKASEVLQQFNGQSAGSKMQELMISYAKPREGRSEDRPSRPRRSSGNRQSGNPSNPYY